MINTVKVPPIVSSATGSSFTVGLAAAAPSRLASREDRPLHEPNRAAGRRKDQSKALGGPEPGRHSTGSGLRPACGPGTGSLTVFSSTFEQEVLVPRPLDLRITSPPSE
jgi:hypothetical protein